MQLYACQQGGEGSHLQRTVFGIMLSIRHSYTNEWRRKKEEIEGLILQATQFNCLNENYFALRIVMEYD